MARSCSCAALLSRAVTDAAFRVLPPMVRLVWLELMAWSATAPTPGHIRFLRPVSGSVSGLLNLPETETETALETLRALSLLELDADGCGLWLAGAKARAARSETAKLNGLRGGRPRKGDTPQSYMARRQGHLPLPIQGGRAETQETKTEPAGGGATTTTESMTTVSSGPVSGSPEHAALGEEVAVLAGLDPARQRFDYAPVREWLEAGATREAIIAGVKETIARPTYAAAKVHSLRYFGRAIETRIQAAPRPRSASGWAEAFQEHVSRGGNPAAFPTKAQWLARQAHAA